MHFPFINKSDLIISITFLFFISFTNWAQTTIEGKITNMEGNIVNHGVVMLKNSNTNVIESYASIDDLGKYSIEFHNKDNVLLLEVSSLGYEKKKLLLDRIKLNEVNKKDFILRSKDLELKEVIVESSPIKIKKDTIEFTASRFKQGNEENVEDLLKKIPGIIVEKDGKIKYGRQEIEKVMIDYEDLFDKGYKILTKNMPVNPIKKIEVLKNYTSNGLLKDIEKTNKVALNLKLDEKYKRLWFGNIKSNTSVASEENFYNLTTNLMNFGKKSKYYLLSNFNNTGFETIGDVAELMSSIDFEGYFDENEVQKNKLLDIKRPSTIFAGERTNFNDSELISTSSIFNFSKKTKLKAVSFINTDENLFSKNLFDQVNTGVANFSNKEDSKIKSNKRSFLGKLELTSNLRKFKDEIIIRGAIKHDFFDKSSQISFNNTRNIRENLDDTDKLFDIDAQYTNKLNRKKAFVIKLKYSNEKVSQIYHINRFLYGNIFANSQNIKRLSQFNKIRKSFYNLEMSFLNRTSNKHYFRFKLGHRSKTEELKTNLKLIDNIGFTPNGYLNDLNLGINELYSENNYTIKYDQFEIDSELNLYYVKSQLLEINKDNDSKNFVYINPKIGFNWNINRKNRFNLIYLYNTRKSTITDIYQNTINTGFLNFSKGTGKFDLLNSSKAFLGYEFGNPNSKFTGMSNVSLTNQHDYFSTNTIINQNSNQTTKVLFKDGVNLKVYNQIEYYIDKFSTNFRLGLEYSKNSFQNSLNNSLTRNIEIQNYRYNLELRSAFKNNIFNYHIGTDITNTIVKTFINNSYKTYVSFLNLYFSPSQRFDFNINSVLYNLNSSFSNSNIFFLDFNAKYKVFKGKVTLGLVAKNLLNVKNYKEVTITENYFSTLNYKLLPRYVLFRLDYNF